jgi:leukotriene-A4 hydrolase
LTQIGRMKFLRPLFVALGRHARTRQLGREIYDTAHATYHSLSQRVIAAVMAQWTTP